MFSVLGPMAFIIPAIIYLVIIGLVIWLVLRLVRSNEEIAQNTAMIAQYLKQRNAMEREQDKNSK
ncbi:hypothetical protein [Gracilimonas tropica]|uniref:hypothetical protein n=1 Tax=Gracilimonas tropica TaxID=454600 RepID=UPI000361C576|nr:hypothetical protein [Gracilimonas tropica]